MDVPLETMNYMGASGRAYDSRFKSGSDLDALYKAKMEQFKQSGGKNLKNYDPKSIGKTRNGATQPTHYYYFRGNESAHITAIRNFQNRKRLIKTSASIS